MDSICEQQRAYSDSVATYQANNIKDYKKVIENHKEETFINENTIKGLSLDLETANKETRRQKAGKWVAIVVGGALNIFTGFKYLTK